MENKKVFSKYVMSFEELKIIGLVDSNGKETLFSWTFYQSNKDVLDAFENIDLWVKPKKETNPKKNVIISLDDFACSYSNNNAKVSEEDLNLAMKILRNEMSEQNPEIQKKKALLLKYNNDIKVLNDLASDGMTFDEEIDEINEKIDVLKKEINDLLNVE